MSPGRLLLGVSALSLLLALSDVSGVLGEARAAEVDYQRDIKPLLTEHCGKCHGATKQENGLRLDSSQKALAGGDTGPAILPGKAAESLLILAITGQSDEVSPMPPKGPPLSASQVALLSRWIDSGAKAPDERPAETAKSNHWAFQAIVRPLPPDMDNQASLRNAIDTFVLAKLAGQGLSPSPQADRATLIRRVSLDLLGLLPTPGEVQDFVHDPSPDAYERLVDRLFASPHYGERWGRHWLDLARYADSNGYTIDSGRQIWKYRDWVLGAINRGQPFDQFAIEQLAGDMLPGAATQQLVATGFHRNTLTNEEGGTDDEQFRVESIVDRVATVGSTFLGLTLGCARCHTHKYDPITQVEYYQIYALLNNCDEPTLEAPSALQVMRGDVERRNEIRKQIKQWEKKLKDRAAELKAAQDDWEKNLPDEERFKLPQAVKAAVDQPVPNRVPEEWKLIEDHFRNLSVARKAFPALEEIAKLRGQEPKIETTMIVRERAQPRETFVHRRGDFLDLGQQVVGDVPAVLPPLEKTPGTGGGSRLDFARWLVSPDNPLTPRVVMNRHWQQFFGRGLVETEDDFGLQGTPPTHPALLDWLAAEFAASWDVKRLQRQMVSSNTYRQSSKARPDLAEQDPYNKLLARQARLRLDAEIVRDATLSAAGLLTPTLGGPSVFPPQPDGVYAFTQTSKNWIDAKGVQRYRRGMYTHFWRSAPYPSLMVFDAPTGNFTCTRRIRSNTPLQALTLANDEAFVECAQALAQRVLREVPGDDDVARAAYAFRVVLARGPSAAESDLLQAVLMKERAAAAGAKKSAGAATSARWVALSRVLLNLDETITRE